VQFVGVQTRMHLWVAWLQIAIRNAAEARHAREHGVAPSSVEAPSSAALSREFQCSMTAIAAVAFALEALPKEIEDAGHELDRSRFTKPTATNAGFYIAHRIVQAFSLAGSIGFPLFSLPRHTVGIVENYRGWLRQPTDSGQVPVR